MTEGVEGLRDVADGLGLLLSTQSFAARALLGSLIAAAIAAVVVRVGCVRSRRARRILLLTPVATAAAAAVASAGDAFLPELVVATSGAGEPLVVFSQEINILRLEWVLVAYTAVASFLLLRRLVSHLAIATYVRRAVPCDDQALLATTRRLASKVGMTAPELLLVPQCPGGAFTTGMRRPVICADPALLDNLDPREREGLLAHELAHVARRDVAINLGIGVLRDLTFFVAPLHLAAKWLRTEQEHAADDLASDATGRPAALASSILKVWEGSSRSARPLGASMACATMVPARLPVPVGVPTRILRQGGLRGGAKQIAERVVRLIEGDRGVSTARERVELFALAALVGTLTAATVILPAQLAGSSLVVGQFSRPVSQPVQSPALATFEALTPPPAAVPSTERVGAALSIAPACATCLQMESVSNWRNGTRPPAPARTNGWATGRFGWEDGSPALVNAPRAEPLWGVDSPTNRVGVFVVR